MDRAGRPGGMTPPRRMPRPALVLLACLLLAGCSTTQPSAPAASPGPTGGAPPAGAVLGCISVEAPECQFIAEHVVAALPAARGPAFAIEIQLYGCPNDGPCPRSLGVRDGKALIEYVDGEPIELTLAGPPQTPRIGAAPSAWSGLIQPASPRVGGPGPIPFEVGHCGISHVVDFDGSFWVPVGQVDGDASGFMNAESGQMLLLGPNVARYIGATGFTVQLARFPGPKHFWLCA